MEVRRVKEKFLFNLLTSSKRGKYFTLSFFIFIFAFFLSPQVFAVGLFEVLPTDKSLEYLGIIFGGNVGTITLSGDTNPMLSRMFERFNFIIVSIGVFILSYIGIAAAINTAREGEAMGKKFSLWVPLRAMLGMLLMVPSPGTGYSVVQMTVMWVVLNGIGAANTVWNVVLDQMLSGVKAVGKVDLKIDNSDLYPVIDAVLTASTCMQLLNNTPGLELVEKYGPVKPIVKIAPAKIGTNQIERSAEIMIGLEGTNTPDLDNNLCGGFKVNTTIIKGDRYNSFNMNSLDTRLAVKINAVMAMISVVEPVTNDLRYVKMLDDEPTPPTPQEGYVRQAINAYKGQMVQLATGVNVAAGPPPKALDIGSVPGSQALTDIAGGLSQAGTGARDVGLSLKEAWETTNDKMPIQSEQVAKFKRLGWIHAGSYYFSMTKSAENITLANRVDQDALIKLEPTYIPEISEVVIPLLSQPANIVDPPLGWVGSKKLYEILKTSDNRKRMIRATNNAKVYSNTDRQLEPNSLPELGSGKVSSGNGFVDKILSGISDKIRKPIIEKFQSGFMGQSEDPLLSIGRFGWEIMMSGELSIFYALVVGFAISMAASPAACMNPAAYAVNQLLIQLYIVIFTFLCLMWALGATMGVYIPLIPYIVFTSTAVGWLLAVIEAIVAAPLIALAMVQPGGEELGALKQPLLILANLFLRPTLMIFGFVIAGSFLRAILTMINFGFSRAIEESVIPTLFGIIPVVGIYAGFAIAMINEAFSLIYELPNKVLRYMGGQAESFSPKELMGAAEKGGKKGADIGSKGMEAGGKAVASKAKSRQETMKQMREDKIKGGGS